MVMLFAFHPLTFRHRVNFDEADFCSYFQYFLIPYSVILHFYQKILNKPACQPDKQFWRECQSWAGNTK